MKFFEYSMGKTKRSAASSVDEELQESPIERRTRNRQVWQRMSTDGSHHVSETLKDTESVEASNTSLRSPSAANSATDIAPQCIEPGKVLQTGFQVDGKVFDEIDVLVDRRSITGCRPRVSVVKESGQAVQYIMKTVCEEYGEIESEATILSKLADAGVDTLTEVIASDQAEARPELSHDGKRQNVRRQAQRIVMERLTPLRDYYEWPAHTFQIIRDAMLCYYEAYWVGGYVQAGACAPY
jgi:hypothetical protein